MCALKSDVDEIILKTHSAAMRPELWTGVMEGLAQLLDADSAMLFSLHATKPASSLSGLYNLDPRMMDQYAQSFVPLDEWLLGAVRQNRLATGVVSAGEQLVDRSVFCRSTFYNELLLHFGMDRFLNITLQGPQKYGASPEAVLSFYRKPGRSSFEQAGSELLKELSNHLTLAIRNLQHARGLRLDCDARASALDQVGLPMWLLDGHGCIVFTNSAGEEVLSSEGWVCTEGRRLVTGARCLERERGAVALHRLLKGFGSNVLLEDRFGRQAVLVLAPLEKERVLAQEGAVGVAWIVDFGYDDSPINQVSTLFALSPAEARLLRLLVRGEGLPRIAEMLLLSIETVRTQLKSIFGKTGRRSQTELILLVQRMAAIRANRAAPGR